MVYIMYQNPMGVGDLYFQEGGDILDIQGFYNILSFHLSKYLVLGFLGQDCCGYTKNLQIT